jgi:hypothetical protein
MNVFCGSDFQFAALSTCGKKLLITCNATNTVLVADADTGKVAEGSMAISQQAFTGFNKPQGIAVDPLTGIIYVADQLNHCVKVFEEPFALQSGGQGAMNQPIGVGMLEEPCGLALDKESGWLYVADKENHRVVAFNVRAPAGADPMQDVENHIVFTAGDCMNEVGDSKQDTFFMFRPRSLALYRDLLIVGEWGPHGRLLVFDKRHRAQPLLVLDDVPHTGHMVVDDRTGSVYVAQMSPREWRIVCKLQIRGGPEAGWRFDVHCGVDRRLADFFVEDETKGERVSSLLFYEAAGQELVAVTTSKLIRGVFA